MLACSRIGAIHSVVFGGFASEELGRRIQHAEVRYNSLVSERPRASVQNISFANWKRILRVSGYFGLHDFMKMYQVSSPAKIQLPLSLSTGKTKWQHITIFQGYVQMKNVKEGKVIGNVSENYTQSYT